MGKIKLYTAAALTALTLSLGTAGCERDIHRPVNPDGITDPDVPEEPTATEPEREGSLYRLENREDFEWCMLQDKSVVKFGADWCGPCLAMEEYLPVVAESYDGGLVLGTFNVDNDNALFQEQGGFPIPRVNFYDSGVMTEHSYVGNWGQSFMELRIDEILAGRQPGSIIPSRDFDTEEEMYDNLYSIVAESDVPLVAMFTTSNSEQAFYDRLEMKLRLEGVMAFNDTLYGRARGIEIEYSYFPEAFDGEHYNIGGDELTLVFFKDGEEQARSEGVMEESDLVAWVDLLLNRTE